MGLEVLVLYVQVVSIVRWAQGQVQVWLCFLQNINWFPLTLHYLLSFEIPDGMVGAIFLTPGTSENSLYLEIKIVLPNHGSSQSEPKVDLIDQDNGPVTLVDNGIYKNRLGGHTVPVLVFETSLDEFKFGHRYTLEIKRKFRPWKQAIKIPFRYGHVRRLVSHPLAYVICLFTQPMKTKYAGLR